MVPRNPASVLKANGENREFLKVSKNLCRN
jgi:hypothetical protein